MKFKGLFVVKKIGESFYAVPTGKTATEMKCMIKLNDTASLLFESAINGTDENGLCELLTERFGIPMEQAKEDVEDFVSTLKGANIIE